MIAAPVVLYRDAHVVAVNKPPGMLTIPGAEKGPTLREAVEAQHGRVWVVHRLDRDTSGVVLFALSAAAHRALNIAFEKRRVHKTYLALVAGDLAAARLIDAPVFGKPARTAVRPLERLGAYTWVEARPREGRRHQIRAHLASIGHALAPDPEYGEAKGPCPRTPLHAARVDAPHPAGRGRLVVEAPLPDDLASALAALRRLLALELSNPPKLR